MSRCKRVRSLFAAVVVVVGCMLAAAVLAAPAGAVSTRYLPVAGAGVAGATVSGPAWPNSASAQFVTIDVPGSITAGCSPPDFCSPPVATRIGGINNAGTLAGTWTGTAADFHGFIQQPGGQPTTFDYPGTSCCTQSAGINDVGTVVGNTLLGVNPFVFQGWVRSPDDSFTKLDDPLGVVGFTNPMGISDTGLIVGYYFDASGVAHGFIYRHGTFTTLDFPGGSQTALTAVDSSGAIVGFYRDASSLSHGFRYRNGMFTTIAAPGAGTNPAGTCSFFNTDGTIPTGISSNGVMVGDICNDAGSSGWVSSNGQFSSLNDPNAAPGGTYLDGISSNGRKVAGTYFDTGGVQHGLVATLRREARESVRDHAAPALSSSH